MQKNFQLLLSNGSQQKINTNRTLKCHYIIIREFCGSLRRWKEEATEQTPEDE